ncbi:hypothetical protein INR49_029943 [Caranx melampygus]|nr:hypothetical protein INR49_029943 [Caranx melampygus]
MPTQEKTTATMDSTSAQSSSSSGHQPSSQALHVNSSWTYSLSLHVVQIQQQLTSPFRITCTHRGQTSTTRGLAADRAHHVTAVHPQLVVIDAQDAFMPGAHIYIVIATITHTLEIHDVIPGRERERVGGPQRHWKRYCQNSGNQGFLVLVSSRSFRIVLSGRTPNSSSKLSGHQRDA